MSGFPRLPIHTGDYIKDTPPICRANWEHHGIYFIALMIAWNNPRCRLPNDPRWLAQRFGCAIDEYKEFIEPILLRYFKSDGNWLRQKRLSLEHRFVEKQSARAKSRWNKEKKLFQTNVPADAIAADAPTPTPTPTKNIVRLEHPDFAAFYAAYPKRQSRKTAAKAYAKARADGVSHETIMAGLSKALRSDSRFREIQFTPLPASWLNAGGWADEAGDRSTKSMGIV